LEFGGQYCMTSAFLPKGKAPQYSFDRKLSAPQSHLESGGDKNITTPLPIIESRPSCNQPHYRHNSQR